MKKRELSTERKIKYVQDTLYVIKLLWNNPRFNCGPAGPEAAKTSKN